VTPGTEEPAGVPRRSSRNSTFRPSSENVHGVDVFSSTARFCRSALNQTQVSAARRLLSLRRSGHDPCLTWWRRDEAVPSFGPYPPRALLLILFSSSRPWAVSPRVFSWDRAASAAAAGSKRRESSGARQAGDTALAAPPFAARKLSWPHAPWMSSPRGRRIVTGPRKSAWMRRWSATRDATPGFE
jgi:hypothetical protein